MAACRQLAGDTEANLTTAELLAHPAVVGTVRDGLARSALRPKLQKDTP